MAKIGGISYLLIAISAMICGWPSDHWIAAGESLTRVRNAFTGAGFNMRGQLTPAVVAKAQQLPRSIDDQAAERWGYDAGKFANEVLLSRPSATACGPGPRPSDGPDR